MIFDDKFTSVLKNNLNELKESFNLKGIRISRLLFEQKVTTIELYYINEILTDDKLRKTFEEPGEYLTVLGITSFAFGVYTAHEWIHNADSFTDNSNEEEFTANYKNVVSKFEKEGPVKLLKEILDELLGSASEEKINTIYDILALNIKMVLSEIFMKEGDGKEKDPRVVLALFTSIAEIGANTVYEIVYKDKKGHKHA